MEEIRDRVAFWEPVIKGESQFILKIKSLHENSTYEISCSDVSDVWMSDKRMLPSGS